jgi:4-aminobutyrate aminotransferase
MLATEVPPSDLAAMIVEPVLGEGGYVVPPVAWLRGLRERCDRYGILLVFDEVQCGMGRTGRPFAAETFGVTPDIILFAKGVASGLPLGGIIAPRARFDWWPTGTHGSTFGGNPLACAAALASLDVLDTEHCYERARRLGERALERLRGAAAAAGDRVVDVRGIGLMVGVQLRDSALADAVQQACLAEGMLVLTCGPDGEVLRLIPPLTISDADFEHGMDILGRAIASAG